MPMRIMILKNQGKAFFSEEKKQKTFALWRVRLLVPRRLTAGVCSRRIGDFFILVVGLAASSMNAAAAWHPHPSGR
jgi:hypothetical protein